MFSTWTPSTLGLPYVEREWAGATIQHSLREAIICFERKGRRERIGNEKIIDYKAVVNLVLKRMYENAMWREEREIIPEINPTPLNIEKLIEQGLIAEESGQIKPPFKV